MRARLLCHGSVVAVALATTVLTIGLAPAAGATPLSSGEAHRSHHGFVLSARAASSSLTSSIAAGYEVDTPALASVSARFKLPAFTCTSLDAGIFPGVFFFGAGTNTFDAAAVTIGCQSGAPMYLPSVVVNGNETDGFVNWNAGDTVSVSVKLVRTSVVATVTDVTTSAVLTATGTKTPLLGLLIGDDALVDSTGALLPPNRFAKVTFTSAKGNANPIGILGPDAYARYNGATLQIATNPLLANNTTFSTVFKHY